MTDSIVPAPRPCISCPYRRDVASGVWSEHEYVKLPPYDNPQTAFQPPSAFFCHQQDGKLCAGWVAVHDMSHNLGFRLLASFGAHSGELTYEDYRAVVEYTTDVPLFASGAEACAHGLRDLENPGPEAKRMMAKIERRQARGD